jgi:large subunit ribosomal protein L24
MYQAPTHVRRARVSSHLDEPLLLKYNTRSATVRKGDTVRVMRGEYAGTSGKVLEVDTRSGKVTVDGVTVTKADATQKPRPLDPSNLVITKLNLEDPFRREKLGASESDVDREDAAAKPKKSKKKESSEEEAEE